MKWAPSWHGNSAERVLDLPRVLVFVTREDKRRANFESVVEQLRERFGANITPLELPLGEEESFTA